MSTWWDSSRGENRRGPAPCRVGRLASRERRARGLGAAPEPRLGRVALRFVLARGFPAAVRPCVVAAMFELLHFDAAPAGPAGCNKSAQAHINAAQGQLKV